MAGLLAVGEDACGTAAAAGWAKLLLLAADAAFSPRNWQEEISPGFGFDEEMQRKSLRWLREMAEDPACAGVLCSHDPDLSPGTLEF